MLREIVVFAPIKTAQRYEFRFSVQDHPDVSFVNRSKAFVKRNFPCCVRRKLFKCGFLARNCALHHSQLWDSVFPLLFLTRHLGPLFDTRFEQARILFKYPILEKVRDFYIRRAARFGLRIAVEGPTFDRSFEVPAEEGLVVMFSGGKESRLIYSMLRELGKSPKAIGCPFDGEDPPPDVAVDQIIPLRSSTTSVLMAALMSPYRWSYFGTCFADTLLVDPWMEYYDWTPGPQLEFSTLLRSLGVERRVRTPCAVLPCSVVQNILARRYVESYRHQESTPKEQPSEKNLHVALLKLYHGLDFQSHCSAPLFVVLARRFIEKQLVSPCDHGFRDHRKLVHMEMRAILFRLRGASMFEGLSELIPNTWDAEWIDQIHPYVYPELEREFLEIYRESADVADERETISVVGKREFQSDAPLGVELQGTR